MLHQLIISKMYNTAQNVPNLLHDWVRWKLEKQLDMDWLSECHFTK